MEKDGSHGNGELHDQGSDRKPASGVISEAKSTDEVTASPPTDETGAAERGVTSDDARAAAAERRADQAVVAEMRQKSRRSFIVGGGAALAALGGWRWLRTRREVDGLAWPLRLSHEFNEQLSQDYFSRNRMVPTFPGDMASEPRVNGSYGLDEESFDPANWRLAIVGLASPPESVAEKPAAYPEEPNTKSSTGNSSLSGRSKTKAGTDSKSDVQSAGDSSDQSDETDGETDSESNSDTNTTNTEPD